MRCARWAWLLTIVCAVLPAGHVEAASAASCGPPGSVSPQRVAIGQPTSLPVTVDSGSARVTLKWGDGTVDSRTVTPDAPVTFTHAYRAPGTYRVFLDDTGIDTDGVITCSDVNQLQGVVVVVAAAATPAPAPAAPVACFTSTNFTLTGRTGRVGVPFIWTSTIGNWPSLTYTISWGDGTSDTANFVRPQVYRWSHTYPRAGSYDIHRQVVGRFTNGRPCQHDESLGTVRILDAPQPRPAPRPPTPVLPVTRLPSCARTVSQTAYWHHQMAVRHRAVRRAKTPQARKRAQHAYLQARRSWKTWRARKLSAC